MPTNHLRKYSANRLPPLSCHLSDVVGLAVPFGKRGEIFLEGVEVGRELGVEHVVDVADVRAFHPLVYPAPEGVAVAVGQFPERLFVRPFQFALACDDVDAEKGFAGEERFDFLYRGAKRFFLLPALFAAFRKAARPVLFRLLVTGAEDRFDVCRPVVAERFHGPGKRFGLRHAVEVEEVTCAHDVFVMVARLVGDAFGVQQLVYGFGGGFCRGAMFARHRRAARFPPGFGLRLFGQLDRERECAGVEAGLRVVGQPADAFGVFA